MTTPLWDSYCLPLTVTKPAAASSRIEDSCGMRTKPVNGITVIKNSGEPTHYPDAVSIELYDGGQLVVNVQNGHSLTYVRGEWREYRQIK